ncbi:hypothetical protein [Kingella potus]|uniref:hypothetical protein n=1 Tax=Kingella potus TaxID=265175 RepID=UPI001FD06BA2|nr:hypothetical protein [Kingella potus]UOP01123.1 hypothetical protein LVJ84_01985 [Kingella potus]
MPTPPKRPSENTTQKTHHEQNPPAPAPRRRRTRRRHQPAGANPNYLPRRRRRILGNHARQRARIPNLPGNKLVFKTAKYGKFTPDELARYQKIIISKAYRSLPANAGLEDYLPVFAEQSGQYSPAAVGWLYFLAANGNRDMNAAARKRLHAKAFSFLNKAVRDNNTNPRDLHSARYALAGMYRISGDFARAETLLRQLLQQNLDPADRTAAQYVLDSVRLRDRGHILPQFHRPQMP